MTSAEDAQLVERRVEDWRRRLIDLSHRNRLIAFKPTRATTLQIVAPGLDVLLADPDRGGVWDFYLPPEPEEDEPASDASETADELDRIAISARREERRRRPNEIEVTELSPKRIARILDNLAKRSNTEFQDKALRILYIAAGFLDWHDPQRGKDISSPLALVPIELTRESTRHPYRLSFVADEEIVINPSLTEKLRRDAGLDVPGDWLWEDKPIRQELDEIRQAVAGMGWTVREDAAIGLFSFQKYVMFRDLLDHESHVVAHPLVRSLAAGRLDEAARRSDPQVPEPSELDDAQPPAKTLSILDSDASQRQCIEAAKRGRSFVMQGPPGTGKSQTIANVIAEAIGQGKRILFVSEKAAALDVVHHRLAATGLDEYCLMLHGEHAGRREVVQSLDRSLTSSLQPRPGMRIDELERLANLRTLLNETAELLHLQQPLLGGRTLREVHEQLAQLHLALSVPGAPKPSTRRGTDVLDESVGLTEVFERLTERWKVSPVEFVWRGYAGERFTVEDRGQALAVLRELDEATTALSAIVGGAADGAGWPVPSDLAETRRLAALGAHLTDAPVLEPHWLDDPAALRSTVGTARDAYERRAGLAKAFTERFPHRASDEFPADLAAELAAAKEAVRRVCGWSTAWEDRLDAVPAALDALDALPALVEATQARARAVAELLGQPRAGLSAERLGELAELADLAFLADARPERTWLVRAGLTRAQQTLDTVANDLATFQSQRARLREHYTDDVLQLDAAKLRDRFSTRYTSFFARLSGDYRRDTKAIRATRPDGKLPPSLDDDLALIASTRELGIRIDAQSAAIARDFGSYGNGRETSPDVVRDGLQTAQRVIELSHPDADSQALASAVAVGSDPEPAAAQAADRLRSAVDVLQARLPALERFVAWPHPLFGGDLDQLADVISRVGPVLTAYAALASDLDTGASEDASTLEEIRSRAQLVTDVHASAAVVREHRQHWSDGIGPRHFAEAATDWPSLLAVTAWAEQLEELIGTEPPAALRDRLLAPQRGWPDFAQLDRAVKRMTHAAAQLTGLFDPDRGGELERQLDQQPFGEVRAVSAALIDRVDELRDWTEWRQWRGRAAELGWDRFVDALTAARATQEQVLPAFQRAYWNRRLEALYDDDPELAEDLRGGAFQRWVDEFRALDRRLVRTGADRLISQRERERTSHIAGRGSEVELLRREARKMRRHLPVRVLLSRIPTLLSELKPCLMMSPLTVSHFLSADHSFDLVVFDEASQVPPQDAVNCIYRGKQLIVAGDSKQLPPTPFFQVAELDELAPEDEDASTQEDMESVLDACDALLPSHSLSWHYRSRSEPLIAFSNRHIYDGRLVTFPSAEHRSATKGVEFVHVPDGVYDRGRSASNRREAQVVADRVRRRLLDGSGRSVGVIAFNSTQAAAIAEELDLLKAHHPELEEHFRGDRLDAVFVKHLEAVQGDERDVIIFSVGYGPDADGKFLMNFGPLNKQGGQRRLNVAVTRAREKVELVASVRARDFNLSETSSNGARLLRDYVAYAESGGRFSADEAAEERDAEWPTALEEEVGVAIAELGYVAVPDVGVGSFRIDVGVKSSHDADAFLLGIECDGDGYAQTATARDRERLRHEVLDQLGWGPIHRIWSLDWVQNRSGELARLAAALEAAAARARAAADAVTERTDEDDADEDEAPRERIERPVPELDTSAAAAELPWTVHYRRANLGTARSHYEFHESVNRRQQTSLLLDLIAVEAPVSIDYAIRRVAEAFGLARVGHRVAAAGRQSINQASRAGGMQVRGDFLWRPGQTLADVRIPDPHDDRTRRDIDDIPPEEIALAVARLDEASAGSDDEQLLAQTARVLGFDRTGGRIRTVIEPHVRDRRKRDR